MGCGLLAANEWKTHLVATVFIEKRVTGIGVAINDSAQHPLYMRLARQVGRTELHVFRQGDKTGVDVLRNAFALLPEAWQWLMAFVLHLNNLIKGVEWQPWMPRQQHRITCAQTAGPTGAMKLAVSATNGLSAERGKPLCLVLVSQNAHRTNPARRQMPLRR